jgi:flagellar export protein FliJ
MSKPHFRLATLLRLREMARDERRQRMTDAQRADAALEEELGQVELDERRLRTARREAAKPGAVDLARLAEADRYAESLRARKLEILQRRAEITLEIERLLREVVEADREVRTLETLRDHQAEALRIDEDRQASKRLDEAALQAADLVARLKNK